ncbi:HEPN domain-containing protein [Tunturiibacter gelidoferens]|uniref:Apea-like HEPN domain-containing protein n=1 Tax=Tunturiibacter gelidiferens TaxID=3069689 RepID=A0A9X0QFY2_9BACT|nr:HEPN domain-containing protein [Edaphobacter lichenicola]MBB5329688.1 hypothetical protein [Edaphobacter lichenicola]
MVEYIRQQALAEKSFAKRKDFPEIAFRDNGMPQLNVLHEGPIDYGKLFERSSWGSIYSALGGAQEESAQIESRHEFKALQSFFRENYWSKFLASQVGEEDDFSIRMFEIEVRLFIADLIDMYVSRHGYNEIDTAELRKIFEPKHRAYSLDHVPVAIWVPFLFLPCDFDQCSLDEAISLKKIPDELQLSRSSTKSTAAAVHDKVLESASHALVLENYTVKNIKNGDMWESASQPTAFPLDTIDTLIGLLRVASGIQTGYAQLLIEPVDTVTKYGGIGRQVIGTSVRKYPNYFENYYWDENSFKKLSYAEASHVRDLWHSFSALSESNKNRVALALRRLNQSYLRESQEDSILDLTMAFEVLLVPNETQELTYKLSMRLAGLLGKYDKTLSVKTVFSQMKQIYKHRSNVIHGNIGQVSKSREIKVDESTSVPTVDLAIKYLRKAVDILIQSPELLNASLIDTEILLNHQNPGQP